MTLRRTALLFAALSSAWGLQSPTPAARACHRAFQQPRLRCRAARPLAALSNADFMAWAAAAGVATAPGLEVADCGGYRGVKATSPTEAGKPLVTVPAKLTLVTTTLARTPPPGLSEAGWQVPPEAWQPSPWYVRLALLLLKEQSLGDASPKALWLQALPPPAAFADLPMYWPPDHRDALQHEPLGDAADAQAAEYRAALAALQAKSSRSSGGGGSGGSSLTAVSPAEFEWAVHVVRSRAFSGPYEGSGYVERVATALFAGVLALGAVASGAASGAQVANGLLAVVLTTVLRDFLLSSQGTLTRYVLCPYVDMFNHKSSVSSDVAYEYFTNSFACGVGTSHAPGDQVSISYGRRSNDQLLLYYGFVEADNPDDQCEVRSLLELVDGALPGGVPAGRLKLLQQAGLLEQCRSGVATPGGFVDACGLAVRALVATEAELQAAGGGVPGCLALANGAGVRAGVGSGGAAVTARAQAALGAACRARLAQNPTTAAQDAAALKALGGGGKAGFGAAGAALAAAGLPADMPLSRQRLALEYRVVKKQVLQRCASACDANAAMAL